MLIKHDADHEHSIGVIHNGAITHYEFTAGDTKEIPEADTVQVLAVACFTEAKDESKEAVVICPDCQREFKSIQALTGHSQIHKKDALADGKGSAEAAV